MLGLQDYIAYTEQKKKVINILRFRNVYLSDSIVSGLFLCCPAVLAKFLHRTSQFQFLAAQEPGSWFQFLAAHEQAVVKQFQNCHPEPDGACASDVPVSHKAVSILTAQEQAARVILQSSHHEPELVQLMLLLHTSLFLPPPYSGTISLRNCFRTAILELICCINAPTSHKSVSIPLCSGIGGS